MSKFRVVKGKHFQDGLEYKAGEVVEHGGDLIKAFPGKFTLVGNEADYEEPAPRRKSSMPGVTPEDGEIEVPAFTSKKTPPRKSKWKM